MALIQGGTSGSLALGETSTTAYRGDRGKIAYDHSQLAHDKTLVGLQHVDNTSDANKPVSTAQAQAISNAEANANNALIYFINQLIDNAPTESDTLGKLSSQIDTLNAIINRATQDEDNIVNTVSEILNVFANVQEGLNLALALSGKVNNSQVVDNLNQVVPGNVLDARQGRTLYDLINTVNALLSADVSFLQNRLGQASFIISPTEPLNPTTNLVWFKPI